MLDRLVSSLGRWVGRRPDDMEADAERRLWVRYPCNLETMSEVRNGNDPERLAARVRNISRGGLSLVVDREVHPGGLLSVELPAGENVPPSTVLAYVVRSAALSGGDWALGCTFATELSDDDLRPFGAKRERAAVPDLRTWVRFPVDTQASYQVIRGADPTPGTARVLDLSTSGIGLAVARPLEVGKLLSLELNGPGGQGRVSMLASIVRVTPQPEPEWVLGCNFIRELHESELAGLVQAAAD